MQCLQSRDTKTMEHYMHGRLSESEQEVFEAHLLECPDCVSELTRLGALRAVLSQRRADIESAETPVVRSRGPLWLSVAALVVVGLLIVFFFRPVPTPALADLASLEAPIYHPAQLRGSMDEADEAFQAGMALYQHDDFEGAIPALEEATTLDPSRVDALFFLGASELLSGEVQGGIVYLDLVIETGDVQYIEEALYLRAQAHLLSGDADDARGDLRSIIELGGGWRQRARDQLDRLEAWLATN